MNDAFKSRFVTWNDNGEPRESLINHVHSERKVVEIIDPYSTGGTRNVLFEDVIKWTED